MCQREPTILVGAVRTAPGQPRRHRAEHDPPLLRARLVITNDTDGLTSVYTHFTDRERITKASTTGLVFLMGRLVAQLEMSMLFFLRGTLDLQDGTPVAIVEVSCLRRHVAAATMISVEAIRI
jgi:hypothetical protein